MSVWMWIRRGFWPYTKSGFWPRLNVIRFSKSGYSGRASFGGSEVCNPIMPITDGTKSGYSASFGLFGAQLEPEERQQHRDEDNEDWSKIMQCIPQLIGAGNEANAI